MFKELVRKKNQMRNEDALQLLTDGNYGVLGTLSANGYPYTVPLNYVYFNQKIYIHCAKVGLKIENIMYHEKVSFSVIGSEMVDKKELTTKYKSVTLFGIAKIIPGSKEILMELVKKYAKDYIKEGKDAIDRDFQSTATIEIEITHIVGKET